MSGLPRLDLLVDPPEASTLVVLAHGGREFSEMRPSDWGSTVLRMWPFATAAARAAPGCAVGLVRYRLRGWNSRGDPLTDVQRVLESTDVDGYRRIVLVGHSMGGRTVIAAGGHPRVAGLLALAPWLPRGERVPDLSGRLVVLAHGARDRLTSAALTAEFASRLRRSGQRAALFSVDGDTHGMLRRASDWDELVERFVRSSIDGTPDDVIATALSSDPRHGTDPLPHWHPAGPPVRTIGAIARSRLRLPIRRSITVTAAA